MKLTFEPKHLLVEAPPGTKVLAAARQARIALRFGCASCRCGTCAIRLISGTLAAMEPNEEALLKVMKLPTDGQIRLACQARTTEDDVVIDLGFQDAYSPDKGLL